MPLNYKEIDIHGLTSAEAKKKLEQIITSSPINCEIKVIHGFNGGKVLSNMVRKGLKHKRITRRILSMNAGETTLILD